MRPLYIRVPMKAAMDMIGVHVTLLLQRHCMSAKHVDAHLGRASTGWTGALVGAHGDKPETPCTIASRYNGPAAVRYTAESRQRYHGVGEGKQSTQQH